MIPIAIDPAQVRIGLVGRGPQADRRRELLRNAGATVSVWSAVPDDEDLQFLQILWIVGLPRSDALRLAQKARARRILVNVEDVREGCDFHNVAEVRRGDLLLTVSTNGKSPGLAAMIRARLAEMFGPEWGERLDQVAKQRNAARAAGRTMAQVADETLCFIGRSGWLI